LIDFRFALGPFFSFSGSNSSGEKGGRFSGILGKRCALPKGVDKRVDFGDIAEGEDAKTFLAKGSHDREMIRKILFVDDDPILRLAVEKRLETCADDFLLLTASDGFEAVKLLKEHPFSLVILDLVMPRMDGISLIGHLKENYSDIAIVIISSMPADELQSLATDTTVIRALQKPFRADDLIDAIEIALHHEADGGIMYAISPSVFLQMMEMDQRTCTIRILDDASGEGGILFFSEGRLLDARIGLIRGIEAAHRVFSFDSATIFIRNDCPVVADNINSDLTGIIMRAVSLRDEAEGADGFDEDGASGSSFAGDSVLPKELPTPPEIDRLVERFRALLIKNLGQDYGLQVSAAANNKPLLLNRLQALGEASGFAALRAVVGDEGRDTIRLLLPTRPPLRLELAASCPRDTLLRLLSPTK